MQQQSIAAVAGMTVGEDVLDVLDYLHACSLVARRCHPSEEAAPEYWPRIAAAACVLCDSTDDDRVLDRRDALVRRVVEWADGYLPDYHYLGGDGGTTVCFDHEQFDEDRRGGEIVERGRPNPDGRGEYVVSDHGNIDYYAADGTHLWGVC